MASSENENLKHV